MRTVAVVNQKGGSGKTTTTVNLAATLSELKRTVLIIDLDPQASATNWYAVKDAGRGLFDVFTAGQALSGIVISTSVDGVFIAPSSSWMVGAERALASEIGAENILRRAIAALPAQYDYLFIDCPPSLGALTVNALNAATEILVPVSAEYLAVEGLAQLRHTVETVQSRINPNLKYAGILACRVDQRTRHALEVVELLRKNFPELAYKTIIRENVRLSECPAFGQPITLYDSKSPGAADYRALAKELIAQERSFQ
jgi:chromosome partitioning protein